MFSEDAQRTEAAGRILKYILSAQIQSNGAKLIKLRFKVQMDDDPKHISKATQESLKVKRSSILQWPIDSPDINPIEHDFHLLKTKVRAKTHKQTTNAVS